MEPNELDFLKATLRKGIADTLHKLSGLDADPLRDSIVIVDTLLATLSSAGFKVVLDDG